MGLKQMKMSAEPSDGTWADIMLLLMKLRTFRLLRSLIYTGRSEKPTDQMPLVNIRIFHSCLIGFHLLLNAIRLDSTFLYLSRSSTYIGSNTAKYSESGLEIHLSPSKFLPWKLNGYAPEYVVMCLSLLEMLGILLTPLFRILDFGSGLRRTIVRC